MRPISPRPSHQRRSFRWAVTLAASALVAGTLATATASSRRQAAEHRAARRLHRHQQHHGCWPTSPSPHRSTSRRRSTRTWPSRAGTRSAATTTASSSTTSGTRSARASPRRWSAPARRTTSRCTATSSCCRRTRARTDDSCSSAPTTDGAELLGGPQALRHQQPAQPAVRRRGRDASAARTPTRWRRARTGATSTSTSRRTAPSPTLADCQPPHDKISVVKVPVRAPERGGRRRRRRCCSRTAATRAARTPAGNPYSATTGCHDITAYPTKDIAAGACMGDGVLFDIRNRERRG